MNQDALTEDNLGKQRRLWAKAWKALLEDAKPQPESTAERALHSYVRQYLHPQATWADCLKILTEYGALPKKPISSTHPLPWELLEAEHRLPDTPEPSGTAEARQMPWLFHRLPFQGLWALPPNWGQILAEGIHQLLSPHSLKALFASAYDLPFFQSFMEKEAYLQLIAPHLPSAIALAQASPPNHSRVMWANPWFIPEDPAATPTLFSPASEWMESLQQLPSMRADCLYLNTLHTPLERFERGNQKVYEGLEKAVSPFLAKDDFGKNEREPEAWLRLLAPALHTAQRKASALVAILPDHACWGAKWREWRRWVQEHFPHQWLLRESEGAWTACILLREKQEELPPMQWTSIISRPDWSMLSWEELEPLLETQEAGPSHWNNLEWEPLSFDHTTGQWIPQSEQAFFDGIPLFSEISEGGKSPLFVAQHRLEHQGTPILNGLSQEEVQQKLTSLTAEEQESLGEGSIALRSLKVGIERYAWVPSGIPQQAGWYWTNGSYQIRDTSHPPLLGLLGQEKSALFLPKQKANPIVVKQFQKHYRPRVEVPKGMEANQATEWVEQLEKAGRQLPVIQKYIDRLGDFIDSNAKKDCLPFECFEENKALMEQFQLKIQQLYRGANERKSMFKRMLQTLSLWDNHLKAREEEYRAALEKQEAVNEESIMHYAYAVLSDKEYALRYPLGLTHLPPHLPFYSDFWEWASKGQKLLELHQTPSGAFETAWVEVWNEDLPPSLPVFRQDADKRMLQVDSQLRLEELPAVFFDPKGKKAPWLKSLISAFRKKQLSPWTLENWLLHREQFLEGLKVAFHTA